MEIRHATVVLMALTFAACASAPSGNRAGGSQYEITSDQLAQLQDATALEAIRRLRPQWLRARSGSGSPVVHLDGARQRGIDILDQISALDVHEMRFVPGSQATTRYGTGYTNGVILVTTRR